MLHGGLDEPEVVIEISEEAGGCGDAGKLLQLNS
jgi:hypothetical protein